MNIRIDRYSEETAKATGYAFAIEPDDQKWIVFVDTDGEPLVWSERDADGGVVGEPLRPPQA